MRNRQPEIRKGLRSRDAVRVLSIAIKKMPKAKKELQDMFIDKYKLNELRKEFVKALNGYTDN
jgi:hypothetical protein